MERSGQGVDRDMGRQRHLSFWTRAENAKFEREKDKCTSLCSRNTESVVVAEGMRRHIAIVER